MLTAQAIRMQWQPILSDYRLIDAAEDGAPALMQGRAGLWRVRPGFYLYTADWMHLQDMQCQAMLHPGVHVLLRLQGCAGLSLGDTPLLPDPQAQDVTGSAGLAFFLAEPTPMIRQASLETCERMVGLLLMPQWLENHGLLSMDIRAGWGRHLSYRRWRPSARATTLANQLLRQGTQANPLQQLLCESKALELVAEALDFLACDQPESAGLRPDEFRRVSRLKVFLDSGEADRLDLAAIAQYAGCNANSLQQWFRQAYGKTIFDYLRESRLRRAARLLEQDGISVGQAAEVAGYNSQSNFSTAFRRCFGICPKQMRCKV